MQIIKKLVFASGALFFMALSAAAQDDKPQGTYYATNDPAMYISINNDGSISHNMSVGNNVASTPWHVTSTLRGSNGRYYFLAYADFPNDGVLCRYSTRINVDVASANEIDLSLTAPSQIQVINGACTFIGEVTGYTGFRK